MPVSDKVLTRFGLERVEFPVEQIEAVMSRIDSRIEFFLSRKYLLHEVEFGVNSLAQDCYIQGLLDGAQVTANKSPPQSLPKEGGGA